MASDYFELIFNTGHGIITLGRGTGVFYSPLMDNCPAGWLWVDPSGCDSADKLEWLAGQYQDQRKAADKAIAESKRMNDKWRHQENGI